MLRICSKLLKPSLHLAIILKKKKCTPHVSMNLDTELFINSDVAVLFCYFCRMLRMIQKCQSLKNTKMHQSYWKLINHPHRVVGGRGFFISFVFYIARHFVCIISTSWKASDYAVPAIQTNMDVHIKLKCVRPDSNNAKTERFGSQFESLLKMESSNCSILQSSHW